MSGQHTSMRFLRMAAVVLPRAGASADHAGMSGGWVSTAKRTACAVEEHVVLGWPGSAAVRAGYITLMCLAPLLVYVGGGVLAALGAHVWQQDQVNFYWAVGVVASLIILILPLMVFARHEGWRCAICCLAVTVALPSAAVFACVLRNALDLQALRDRGVTETAVVAAEHVYTPIDPGPRNPDTYSYNLRALAGPPIRRDLAWGYHRLVVGERVTVLSDPAGQAAPSLSLHVQADEQWQEAYSSGGAAAALLAVAAWAAPRPARYRRPILR